MSNHPEGNRPEIERRMKEAVRMESPLLRMYLRNDLPYTSWADATESFAKRYYENLDDHTTGAWRWNAIGHARQGLKDNVFSVHGDNYEEGMHAVFSAVTQLFAIGYEIQEEPRVELFKEELTEQFYSLPFVNREYQEYSPLDWEYLWYPLRYGTTVFTRSQDAVARNSSIPLNESVWAKFINEELDMTGI